MVIGSSAGGLKALTAVIGKPPGEFGAAVFIVQHISPEHHSLLPEILSDTSHLPVVHPQNGDKISSKKVYIAPPDHHLLVEVGHVRVVRGPRENRFRPSIDTLFRSAARAYGPQVVGLVLTGHLDDGTVGLQAVKQRGGIAVVHDPDEAEFASRLVKDPSAAEAAFATADELAIETRIAEQQMGTEELIAGIEAIGTRTLFTCPSCNGALWQIGHDEPLRFRCHIGHSFTANALLADQTRNLENALSSAVRLMEEKVMMARRMAERRRAMELSEAAASYEQYARHLDREVSILRQLLIGGNATRYVLPADENEVQGE